jgi:hypothetical protein
MSRRVRTEAERGRIGAVVKTGARAVALERLLERAGYRPIVGRLQPPRMIDLSPGAVDRVLELYRALGGTNSAASFRPGAWDLAFEVGLVVELDEELHFNRYRALTLDPSWTAQLPWRADYLAFASEHEPACLAAARWGRRWTNPSCERLFGAADPPGTLGSGGAPRWKQRALYDAMKDAAVVGHPDLRLARLSTVDMVGGVRLNDVLRGHTDVDIGALRDLLDRRST